MSTATLPAPTGLPVEFRGDAVAVTFAAAVVNPLEAVQRALGSATAEALVNEPAVAKLKRLAAGTAKVKADLAASRAKVADAEGALTAATDLGDVDLILAARADVAAAQRRVATGTEVLDSLIGPTATAQREVTLVAERAANAAWRSQLDAAVAKVARLRAKAEKTLGPQLVTELAEAAGVMNLLDNAASIFDLGDLRQQAAGRAVAELLRDAGASPSASA